LVRAVVKSSAQTPSSVSALWKRRVRVSSIHTSSLDAIQSSSCTTDTSLPLTSCGPKARCTCRPWFSRQT
jgi:hypothetical protein